AAIPQRQGHHLLAAVHSTELLRFAGDVLRALPIGIEADDLFLIERLFHHPLDHHAQFLLAIELLGVAHRLELDLLALDPAERNARGARAGGQLVAEVHAGRFEAFGSRDARSILENILVSL